MPPSILMCTRYETKIRFCAFSSLSGNIDTLCFKICMDTNT